MVSLAVKGDVGDEVCAKCAWVLNRPEGGMVCRNPMNDTFYDHFNPSSGDMVPRIRQAMDVNIYWTCGYWTKNRLFQNGEK